METTYKIAQFSKKDEEGSKWYRWMTQPHRVKDVNIRSWCLRINKFFIAEQQLATSQHLVRLLCDYVITMFSKVLVQSVRKQGRMKRALLHILLSQYIKKKLKIHNNIACPEITIGGSRGPIQLLVHYRSFSPLAPYSTAGPLQIIQSSSVYQQ